MDYISNFIEDDKIVFQPYSDEQLRDKEYILSVHNTLVQFGYKKIISQEFYDSRISTFIDSLIIYRTNYSDTSNYYYKFWERRKSQQTAELTYKIITEWKAIYSNSVVEVDKNNINDTLLTALNYDYLMSSSTRPNQSQFNSELFDFLNHSKQYSMAYLLLYKPIDIDSLGIDKKAFIRKLPIDTVRQYNSKGLILGYFDKKNNWYDSFVKEYEYPGP